MRNYIVILSALLLFAFALATPVMAKPHHNTIIEVQVRLHSLGYDTGHADGLMGRRTIRAIRQFQRDNHLPPTGRIDQQTEQKLLRKNTHFKNAKKTKNQKAVKHYAGYSQQLFDAQQQLSRLGFHPGKVDGVMGEKTRNALKRFQHNQHLTVTGQLDNRTYKLLMKQRPHHQ